MWKICCRKLICPQYETKRCLTFYTSCVFFVRFLLLNLKFEFYFFMQQLFIVFNLKIMFCFLIYFFKIFSFKFIECFSLVLKFENQDFSCTNFLTKIKIFHKNFSCSVLNSKFEVFSVQLWFYKNWDSKFELIWLIDPVLSKVKSMMGRDFCSQTYSIKKAITLEEEILARV